MPKSKHEIMLTYAHQDSPDGPLVSIQEADKSHNYYCPKCHELLTLKNRKFEGRKKDYHYAHKGDSDCQGAQMTAIHILAQKAILENKKVMLPAYTYADETKEHSHSVSFTEVTLEKSEIINSKLLRPDCVCHTQDFDGKPADIWIEICVTHPVDEEKQQYICDGNIYCIEIDLCDFMDKYNSIFYDAQEDTLSLKDDLYEFLVDDILTNSDNRKWISNPLYDANNAKIIQRLEEERKAHEAEIAAVESARSAEFEKRWSEIEREIQKTEKALEEWFSKGDMDSMLKLINIIKNDLYDESFAECDTHGQLIYQKLTHENGIVDFIQTSPKNEAQKKLFQYLCFYYFNHIIASQEELRDIIKSYQNKSASLDANETISLSQYVIAYFIATTARKWQEKYYAMDKHIMRNRLDLIRKNSEYRTNILICCSFLFHHILSPNYHDYPSLISHVIKYKPQLASLCLMAVFYVGKNKHPDNYISPDGHNWINDLANCAHEHVFDLELYNILREVYPYTFPDVFKK